MPRFEAGRVYLQRPDDTWYHLATAWCQPIYTALTSESCRDEIHKGPPWRDGGPFTKIRVSFPPEQVLGQGTYISDPVTRNYYGITGFIKYVGGFHSPDFYGDNVNYSNLPALHAGVSLVPSLDGWSDVAFARTRPRLEKAGAGIALAELRDVPRTLSQTARTFSDIWKVMGGASSSRIMRPKKIADTFINEQFGWVPMIKDIRDINHVFQNQAKIKSQMRNENNRWIHRKATLLDDYQETKLLSGEGMRVAPAGDFVSTLFRDGAAPHWELWEKKYSHITTSGSFKYYRPEFDDSIPDYSSAWNEAQRQLTMYGIRITPSNVYRATPWTWLIDWFSDFGSVMDRITDWALDSISCRYLFLMRHDLRTITLKQVLPMRGGDVVLNFDRVIDSKIRRGSDSPYGFGLSWNGLSPRQLAILSALKISRRNSNFPQP
jgi:hypothetical protein